MASNGTKYFSGDCAVDDNGGISFSSGLAENRKEKQILEKTDGTFFLCSNKKLQYMLQATLHYVQK